MAWLIVGLARSGTTALFSAVAQSLGRPRLFFEEPAQQLITALHRDPSTPLVAKLIFGNERCQSILEAAELFDHKVLLQRDPRDNLVSAMLYIVATRPAQLADPAFCGQLMDLVRRKQAAPGKLALTEIIRLIDNAMGGSLVTRVLERFSEFAQFAERGGDAWLRLRYEDMVAGRLPAWGAAHGLSLPAVAQLPADLERHVTRSRGAGDWRHWFTPFDVEALRSSIDPVLRQLGYPTDWSLAPRPQISDEHSWRYLQRMMDDRRQRHGVTLRPSCNLCGRSEFGPGPRGRMAPGGAPPHCRGCGSLERQRIVGSVMQALPATFFSRRRGLQFKADKGVDAALFASYEISIPGGPGALDLQGIARDSGSRDFIAISHALEFVADDQLAFTELMRVLSANGVLLACFSGPQQRAKSVDFPQPSGPDGCWHLYGADLAQRFACRDRGLTTLAIEGTDPCTNTKEMVYLFLKDRDDAAEVGAQVQAAGSGLRLVPVVG